MSRKQRSCHQAYVGVCLLLLVISQDFVSAIDRIDKASKQRRIPSLRRNVIESAAASNRHPHHNNNNAIRHQDNELLLRPLPDVFLQTDTAIKAKLGPETVLAAINLAISCVKFVAAVVHKIKAYQAFKQQAHQIEAEATCQSSIYILQAYSLWRDATKGIELFKNQVTPSFVIDMSSLITKLSKESDSQSQQELKNIDDAIVFFGDRITDLTCNGDTKCEEAKAHLNSKLLTKDDKKNPFLSLDGDADEGFAAQLKQVNEACSVGRELSGFAATKINSFLELARMQMRGVSFNEKKQENPKMNGPPEAFNFERIDQAFELVKKKVEEKEKANKEKADKEKAEKEKKLEDAKKLEDTQQINTPETKPITPETKPTPETTGTVPVPVPVDPDVQGKANIEAVGAAMNQVFKAILFIVDHVISQYQRKIVKDVVDRICGEYTIKATMILTLKHRAADVMDSMGKVLAGFRDVQLRSKVDVLQMAKAVRTQGRSSLGTLNQKCIAASKGKKNCAYIIGMAEKMISWSDAQFEDFTKRPTFQTFFTNLMEIKFKAINTIAEEMRETMDLYRCLPLTTLDISIRDLIIDDSPATTTTTVQPSRPQTPKSLSSTSSSVNRQGPCKSYNLFFLATHLYREYSACATIREEWKSRSLMRFHSLTFKERIKKISAASRTSTPLIFSPLTLMYLYSDVRDEITKLQERPSVRHEFQSIFANTEYVLEEIEQSKFDERTSMFPPLGNIFAQHISESLERNSESFIFGDQWARLPNVKNTYLVQSLASFAQHEYEKSSPAFKEAMVKAMKDAYTSMVNRYKTGDTGFTSIIWDLFVPILEQVALKLDALPFKHRPNLFQCRQAANVADVFISKIPSILQSPQNRWLFGPYFAPDYAKKDTQTVQGNRAWSKLTMQKAHPITFFCPEKLGLTSVVTEDIPFCKKERELDKWTQCWSKAQIDQRLCTTENPCTVAECKGAPIEFPILSRLQGSPTYQQNCLAAINSFLQKNLHLWEYHNTRCHISSLDDLSNTFCPDEEHFCYVLKTGGLHFQRHTSSCHPQSTQFSFDPYNFCSSRKPVDNLLCTAYEYLQDQPIPFLVAFSIDSVANRLPTRKCASIREYFQSFSSYFRPAFKSDMIMDLFWEDRASAKGLRREVLTHLDEAKLKTSTDYEDHLDCFISNNQLGMFKAEYDNAKRAVLERLDPKIWNAKKQKQEEVGIELGSIKIDSTAEFICPESTVEFWKAFDNNKLASTNDQFCAARMRLSLFDSASEGVRVLTAEKLDDRKPVIEELPDLDWNMIAPGFFEQRHLLKKLIA